MIARPWPLVLWAAVVFWSAALFAEARSDYLGFRFGRFDLGNMVQAVWSTAHGRPLETTLLSGEQASRLASHVDPILVLFAPLWLLWPSPLLLAAVQIVGCALGALPVFWLGRRHLASERAAGLLALAYLAYPWLLWTALDALHPVTLAIPLLLYAIWFLDSDRLWAFALCAVLIAACGELLGLALAALGLWYWLARRRPQAGLVIAVAGFAWTLVAVKAVIPLVHGGDSPFYGYYVAVGGSPEAVLRTLLTDPGTIASALFSGRDLGYLVLLALPLGGLFLLAPGLAAVAIPQLLANGLSGTPAMTDPRHHYVAAILPMLIVATVFGIARLSTRQRGPASFGVVSLSLAAALLLAPLPGIPGRALRAYEGELSARHVEALRAAVAVVPDDAPVTATMRAGASLSARRYSYTVPLLRRSEWVVLDTMDPWLGGTELPVPVRRPEELRTFRRQLDRSRAWVRVFESDGVYVYRLART